ncbi:hypothetical protein GGP41_009549, partial [Bipolaris sorokiniana]
MDHGLSHASDGIADGLAAVCTVVKGSHMVASQSAFDLTRDMLAEINHKHTEISPMASHSPTWYCFRSLVPTLYIDCRLETFWDQQASLSASASTSTWISSPTGLSHLASSRLASPNPPRALWP